MQISSVLRLRRFSRDFMARFAYYAITKEMNQINRQITGFGLLLAILFLM